MKEIAAQVFPEVSGMGTRARPDRSVSAQLCAGDARVRRVRPEYRPPRGR